VAIRVQPGARTDKIRRYCQEALDFLRRPDEDIAVTYFGSPKFPDPAGGECSANAGGEPGPAALLVAAPAALEGSGASVKNRPRFGTDFRGSAP
jgi:hypothetical protein